MKFFLVVIFSWFFLIPSAWGNLRVITSYPYIADLTKQIGQDEIAVSALASGSWDPHFVPPKPSFIAKVRRADLLIINGAENEIGWLPPIIKQANNPQVQSGQKGFLDLSAGMELMDKPDNLSRSEGDVHAAGNPHFYLDPHNIPSLVQTITNRLCELDQETCPTYKSNHDAFAKKWTKRLQQWDQQMKPLKGRKVIQYHKNFDYFFKRYGINMVSTLEPLPGIPPSTKYLVELIDTAKKQSVNSVVISVYQSKKAASFLANKVGIPVIVLPHDVHAFGDVDDMIALFDIMVQRVSG